MTNHGELVLRFEKELEEYLGVRHCIAMCNGTVALEIAIRALGLSGEVIMPALTFVATAHALQWQGITPVFCDVDPISLCIDPKEVERRITPRTSALLGVHVYGRSCDTEALGRIARERGLHLLYDAAHAFGNTIDGTRIGHFGECEVFSFHATKFFNTFEGGAIATNNDQLAERMRFMRNFGFATTDQVDCIGINGKMTEVCAAMGLTNLDRLDEFRSVNRQNFEAYRKGFEGIHGLALLPMVGSSGDVEHSNHQYVVAVVHDEFPLSRDELVNRLQACGVLARRYFWPGCHRMEPYRTQQPPAERHLPATEAFLDKVVLFPTGVSVTPLHIDRIVDFMHKL